MKTEHLVEGMDYPQPEPEPMPDHHLLLCEVAARLQELATAQPSGTQGVVRILRQLYRLHCASDRAYKLVIDVLSAQSSLEDSLADLAAQHQNSKGEPCSRQNWFQNMQADLELIRIYWPQIGNAMSDIMRRRDRDTV